MKIGNRLSIGFGISILITLIWGISALSEIQNLAKLTESMYQHPWTVSNAVRDIKADILAMHRSMKDVVLAENSKEIDEAAALVDNYEVRVYKNFGIVLNRFLGDLDEVKTAEKAFYDWKVIRDEVISLSRAGYKGEAADITRGKGADHVVFMMDKIDKMIDFAASKAETFHLTADKEREKTTFTLIILFFGVILFGSITSILLTRSIVIPLGIIVKRIKGLSAGELKEEIDIRSNDEVGLLADSFSSLQSDLVQRTQLLERIANGDFSTDIPPRSPKDDLGRSFYAMTSSLRTATEELQKVHSIINSGSVAAFLWKDDEEWSVDFATDNVYQLFGYTSDDFTSGRILFSEIVHPDDLPGLLEEVKQHIAKKDFLTEFEHRPFRIVTRDGKTKWISETSRLRENSKGELTHVQGLIMDITSKKTAEENLKKESSFVELLKKIAVTANESSSMEEAMQVCLDEVCKLMAWPIGHVFMPHEDGSGTLVPTGVWHLGHPERYKKFKEATEKSSFVTGVGLPGRIMADKKPAWIINVHNDSNFFRDTMVKDIGVVTAFGFPVLLGDDVVAILEFFSSTREEPNTKLLEVMENIGKQLGRVAERTSAEKTLKSAKIEAEAANHAKSIFLANMSHELRTPLNAILGFSQILQLDKKKFSSKQMENLQHIVESGEHLLAVVSDILDLSKIESGKMILEKSYFNFNDMVSKLTGTVKAIAGKKNLTFITDTSQNIGTIFADEKRIREILYNLLSNAVKFTDKNKTIGLKAYGEKLKVIIEVWDEGRGIKEEDLDKIFDPFEQVDRQKKEKSQGTGLGLAITKKLVEAHNGELTVESTPGQGSCFTVILPLSSREGTYDS